jgi:hypothetical protein
MNIVRAGIALFEWTFYFEYKSRKCFRREMAIMKLNAVKEPQLGENVCRGRAPRVLPGQTATAPS